MVQDFDEGHQIIIKVQQETGGICQVGSQGMSSLGNEKARQLVSGMGPLAIWFSWICITIDILQKGLGNIPSLPDADKKTVDFDTFLGQAPKVPFDTTRFFRWRNYKDYGTGVAGDLFVHAFSTLNFILSSNGPVRALSTGGLRYWNDGRDVPDVTMTFLRLSKN